MRLYLSFKHLTILIISFSTFPFANDTHIGSIAGSVYLEEKADSIQMIKERVTIVLGKDSSHVKCIFWLVNYGSAKDITVGFPNYHFGYFGVDPVRNFTCKVNGLPYGNVAEVTLQTIYKGSGHREGRQWYTWKTHIDEKDTIKIENEYDGSWGGTVCEDSYFYTIGTGATWAGPIVDGRVTFDCSNLVSTNFIIKSPERLGLGRIKPVYFVDSVVYSFTNYTPHPKEVLAVWLYSTSFFMDYSDLNPCLMRYIESAEDARNIKNEFFALHGYKFTDPDLVNYYSKRKWYKVNPVFDTTRFSNGEKKVIEYLIRTEEHFNKK